MAILVTFMFYVGFLVITGRIPIAEVILRNQLIDQIIGLIMIALSAIVVWELRRYRIKQQNLKYFVYGFMTITGIIVLIIKSVPYVNSVADALNQASPLSIGLSVAAAVLPVATFQAIDLYRKAPRKKIVKHESFMDGIFASLKVGLTLLAIHMMWSLYQVSL